MIYRFIDNNSTDRDIIISVLEHYCVPYKEIRHREGCFFGETYSYDIEVDLNVEETMTDSDGNPISPMDFIQGKVQERLDLEDYYEDSEMLGSMIKQKQLNGIFNNDEEEKSECPYLFKNILDKLNPEEAKKEELNGKSMPDDLIDSVETLLNKKKSLDFSWLLKPIESFWKKDSISDFLNDMKKDKDRDKHKKEYAERLRKLSKDKGFDNVIKEASKEISKNLMFPPFTSMHNIKQDIDDLMSETDNVKPVSFNELPQKIQNTLLNQFPERMLKSKNVRFRFVDKDGKTCISVEVSGDVDF